MDKLPSGHTRSLDLIAATFTAFREDGSLDLDKVEKQADGLSNLGLSGVFICGTTGEGASLSTEERSMLADRWCEVACEDLEVIVHVGHASLSEARSLAVHANGRRVAAIAAVPPYYYRPSSVEDLVDSCFEIAAAAPDTPFYYYHIPSMTGVDLQMAEFLTVAGERIPTFAGIKFTHNDLMDYGRCLELAGDEYEIFFGRDEMLLAGLGLGTRAAVGSTYNFAAPLYRELAVAVDQGDMVSARKAQALARDAVTAVENYGGLPALKATMSWLGVDCGPCRLPLRTLEHARAERLHKELEELGFFARVSGALERVQASE